MTDISQARKIAVCDFDGTLSKGFISIEFMDHLHKIGLYADSSHKAQDRVMLEVREKSITYDGWCNRWAELWAEGLRGKSEKEIGNSAREFFESFKGNIYDSSYKVVDYLKTEDYHMVMLSVGAFEVIELAARELGFNEAYSTVLGRKDGIYDGTLQTRLHLPDGKIKQLEAILRDKNRTREFTMEDTIAMADSSSDISFMQRLDIPIAVNPSHELYAHAIANSWLVLDMNKPGKDVVEAIKRKIY